MLNTCAANVRNGLRLKPGGIMAEQNRTRLVKGFEYLSDGQLDTAAAAAYENKTPRRRGGSVRAEVKNTLI